MLERRRAERRLMSKMSRVIFHPITPITLVILHYYAITLELRDPFGNSD